MSDDRCQKSQPDVICPLSSDLCHLEQAAANFGKNCANPVFPTRIAVSWLLVVDVSTMTARLPHSARFLTRLAETTPRADEISSGGLYVDSEATTPSSAESRPTAIETSLSA